MHNMDRLTSTLSCQYLYDIYEILVDFCKKLLQLQYQIIQFFTCIRIIDFNIANCFC